MNLVFEFFCFLFCFRRSLWFPFSEVVSADGTLLGLETLQTDVADQVSIVASKDLARKTHVLKAHWAVVVVVQVREDVGLFGGAVGLKEVAQKVFVDISVFYLLFPLLPFFVAFDV
jgi:hypothetical protein